VYDDPINIDVAVDQRVAEADHANPLFRILSL
jgi:hypothetical protein